MYQKFPQIPLSKRNHIFYLEHARIEMADGGVVYVKAETGCMKEYNVPYVNTSYLILGEGTSITRDAARILADNGVMVGFAGAGGFPLVSCTEDFPTFLEPCSEYRPTEFMQAWAEIFFDDAKRLQTAKAFMLKRLELTDWLWEAVSGVRDYDLDSTERRVTVSNFRRNIESSTTISALLGYEGVYAKSTYAYLAKKIGIGNFKRAAGSGVDVANRNLDHANYLAYGLSATVLHGLGISFAFPVLHGKTRRGGLVFDVADLIKEGICLPLAFINASNMVDQVRNREAVISEFHNLKIMNRLFDFLAEICQQRKKEKK